MFEWKKKKEEERNLLQDDGRGGLLLDPQARAHVFVHHVADADGRDDLHEIGEDATVKSEEAVLLQDLLHHAAHRQLLRALEGS